jgi:hypothetical protein
VRSVAFSPDGKVLASSGGDGTVRLWDARTGKEVRAFRDHAEGIGVVFSPDGRRLASAAGTAVHVLDLTTGKVVAALNNPGSTVTRLVFSPDGRRLAVANSEGTVRVWDVEPDSSARGPAPSSVMDLQKQLDEERRRAQELLEAARAREEVARANVEAALQAQRAAQAETRRALYAAQIAQAQRAWQADKAELTKRQERMLRWSMKFNTQNGADYVSQLKGLGAILAIPTTDGPNPHYKIIRDLDQRPPKLLDEDLSKIQRIYWVDDKLNSVAGVMEALGLQGMRPSHFVAFMPEKLEQKLFQLELNYKGLKEAQIHATRFEVVKTPNGYEPRVTEQWSKPGV